MPNRFSKDIKVWIYRFLVQRDGPNCQLCGKAPRNGPYSLEIDHKDNNKKNDSPENLQLAHGTCNKRKELSLGKTKKVVPVMSLEGSPATRMVKEKVDYSLGSPEMKANSLFEVQYRQWIIRKITTDGSIVKTEAVNSGAEMVGCSPQTTRRYTDKLLSERGLLQEIKDFAGNNLLIFKDDIIHSISSTSKKKVKKKTKKTTRKTPAAPSPGTKEGNADK